MKRIGHRGLWLTVLLSTVLLFAYFGAVLKHPGHYMFNAEGDGLKNYFSFAWHAEHDTTATTFSGMNFPFGEHIDYPDAQPLESNLWRLAGRAFPAVLPHTVAVMNLMMLGSILICALFLYVIMRGLSMPDLLSTLFAVLISFMAPQVLRGTQAHYALAYGCCIPSAIWLMFRLWQDPRTLRIALAMLALLLFWLFTHVYLGFIAAVLVGLCGLLAGLFRAAPKRNAIAMMAAPAVSLLLFLFWQKITDTHVDRTLHPTGFFDYQVDFSTLLAPWGPFASPIWTRLIGLPAHSVAEGWCYIGLGTLLAVLIFLVVLAVKTWRKAARPFLQDVFPNHLAILLLASVLMLAFAFGLPFDPWFKGKLWSVPVIGQFRAPGRFGWAFYFAITIWAARTTWLLRGRALRPVARRAANGAIAAVLLLFAVDAHYLDRYVARRITERPNYFDLEQLPEDMKAVVQAASRVHAKALATMPYFHNGGEEIMISADEPGLLIGQTVAQHTAIPLMNSSLTRTGLGEVRELIQGFGPDWYPKPIARHFHPADTILLLASGSSMGGYDQAAIAHALLLLKNGPYTLYSITARELFADRSAEYIKDFTTKRDSMYSSHGRYFTGPDTFLFNLDFDSLDATHVRSGEGAFSGMKRDFNLIAALPAQAMDTGITYMASFWYYNRGPMRCHALVGIDDQDPATGKGAWNYFTDPRFARTIVGDWSLVELPFRKGGLGHELNLFITGQPYYRDSIWVDELSVRVADVDVYRMDSLSGRLWFNNQWISP
jgi:hypothetical protein